jgi:hypothetical protein
MDPARWHEPSIKPARGRTMRSTKSRMPRVQWSSVLRQAHIKPVDKIAGAAGQAAETLGVTGEQLKNAQVHAMEQCRGYVRD